MSTKNAWAAIPHPHSPLPHPYPHPTPTPIPHPHSPLPHRPPSHEHTHECSNPRAHAHAHAHITASQDLVKKEEEGRGRAEDLQAALTAVTVEQTSVQQVGAGAESNWGGGGLWARHRVPYPPMLSSSFSARPCNAVMRACACVCVCVAALVRVGLGSEFCVSPRRRGTGH